MAIRLKQAGMNDFVVLERADEVGGTWQANTYPGCACDVPSHLYSFSLRAEPGLDADLLDRSPRSGRTCAACADDFGVRPHVRLNTAVESATWARPTAGSSRPRRARSARACWSPAWAR